jgi:hypothetical protein
MKMVQQIKEYSPKLWQSFSSFSKMSTAGTASRYLISIK